MCIYYKNRDGLTYTKQEHVFPAGLGGKNKLKKGMVSDQANEYFSKLELVVLRKSRVKIPRIFEGPGKRGSLTPNNETKSELTVIDFHNNNRVGFIKKGKPFLATQLVFNGDKYTIEFDQSNQDNENEIRKLVEKIREFDGKYSFIKLKVESSDIIFSLYDKKMYICAFEELDDSRISTIIEPLKGDIKECKHHSDQGQWKGEIEIEEDIIAVKRVVAKIAVNTWAYLYGEDEVQDNKFDCIKKFILSDKSKEGLVSYLPPDTMIKEDCHIGKEHCCLFTVQAGMVYAIIFLYNSGFAVKLFPVEETCKWAGEQIENYIFNGYVCDWMNHEDYEYKEYYHK